MALCGKNFNVAIFSDTIIMINVKLCMMVVLIELYPFIPLSATSIVFQGHSSVVKRSHNIFGDADIKSMAALKKVREKKK